ncbi:MAG TPA: GvpL/GvpF family gas vesicle protein [Pyrinomonadaceae bacterium]|nr:GvpL/GvpF family gas vesicle protein [Pyrinomonadaceae bacterium]
MKFYVYCLSDESDAASVEGLTGVGGASVRLLPVGGAASDVGVVAVASEFGGGRVAVTRENLLAHNRVNAHVLARVTPLPFRFGTLADEARLAAYAAANGTALAEAFARVRGRVEMGVKVRPDAGAQAGAEGSEVNADGVKVEESGAAGVGRGTAFLLAKRREILGEEALKARAEEAAARLAECVESVARESDVRLSPEGPIVVRASHLVAREDVAEYRERVRDLGARLAGMHLLASGPWPPYSFGVTRA